MALFTPAFPTYIASCRYIGAAIHQIPLSIDDNFQLTKDTIDKAFSNKPKVKDLERLPEDIMTVRGFWKNKVTRILLVVVFTNLGSTIGTMVAIPMMVKILNA